MKRYNTLTAPALDGALILASIAFNQSIAQPVIRNPSFEEDQFSIPAGQVSVNGPITGWASVGAAEINPGMTEGGVTFSPFADNGAIPEGNQVAFIQWDSSMRQVVSGFT